MCGFVIFAGCELEFINCENIADDPENFFEVSPDDFLSAGMKGNIVALVHSHPGGEPVLSPADFQMQQNTELDWWLVCDGVIHVFPWGRLYLGANLFTGKRIATRYSAIFIGCLAKSFLILNVMITGGKMALTCIWITWKNKVLNA